MRCGILKCPSCGGYSLEETCPKCSTRTECPHPAKFSFEDKYAKYRRMQLYGTA
ncbi:MAG: nucleolar RNA-binding Nop10p family protein [Candidatus Micrarchaeia archaeon]